MALSKYRTDFIVYEPGEITDFTKPISYAALALDDTIDEQDQLVVIRDFDTTGITNVTGEENDTIRVLPSNGVSGSSMYTINRTEKTITFSAAASDYTWLDVIHHSRGSDIALPIVSDADTIIIARKTSILNSRVTWQPTDLIKSFDFNSSIRQIVKAIEEANFRKEFPKYFDTYVNQASGIAGLDSEGLIGNSYFPDGIGGSGSYVANLEGTRIETFDNILDTLVITGGNIEYRTTFSKWVPSIPFKYLDDNNLTVLKGGILRIGLGGGPNWTAIGYKLNYPDFILAKRAITGGFQEPENAEILQWFPATSKFTLSGIGGDLAGGFNQPTYDGWVMQWNTTSGKWEANSTMIDEVPQFTWENMWLNDISDIGGIHDSNPAYTDYSQTWANHPSDSTVNTRLSHDDMEADGLLATNSNFVGSVNAKLLTWDTAVNKWVMKARNLEDQPNFWAGSATETDANDPKYTNGKVGPEELHEFYQPGWIPMWDPTLHKKNQSPSEDPEGSFIVRDPLHGLTKIVTDKAAATSRGDTNDIEAGYSILNIDSDKDLRFNVHNLENLGNVGTQTPKGGTHLKYDAASSSWIPNRFDNGEEPWSKTSYVVNMGYNECFNNYQGQDTDGTIVLERQSETNHQSSGNRQRIQIVKDLYIPVACKLDKYKILDFEHVLRHRVANQTYLEPIGNYQSDFYSGSNALYTLGNTDGGYQGYLILSMILKISRIRYDISDEDGSETVYTFLNNVDYTSTPGTGWTNISDVSLNAGDLLRVELDYESQDDTNDMDIPLGMKYVAGEMPTTNPAFPSMWQKTAQCSVHFKLKDLDFPE